MPFCSSCGRHLDEGTNYCPSCGHRVSTETPAGPVPPPMPSAPFTPSYPGTKPSYGDADKRALDKLKLFGIIALVGTVLGFVVTFVFSFTGLYSLPFRFNATTPLTTIPPSFFTNLFYTLAVSVAIGGAIEFVSLLQLRSAFKNLAGVDRANFGTPSILTLVVLIALPFLFLGLLIELAWIGPLVSSIVQNPSQPPTTIPVSLGYLLGGFALEGIAGIAAVVGFIGGVVLGIWRVGSRYDRTLFKVAAILFIIPFLQIVSAILVLVGVLEVKGKLELK